MCIRDRVNLLLRRRVLRARERRREQPCPLLLRKLTKQRTVGDRLFENLGGGLQLLD